MKRIFGIALLTLVAFAFGAEGASIEEAKREAWRDYVARERADRENEMSEGVMRTGDVEMQFHYVKKGRKGKDGYPLYIALHGGGASDTPDINDEQYEQMKTYYERSVTDGIYVAVRGVRDTWDTHSNPESYPLYDRLISNMIMLEEADPNRVYLTGFSAGGDGVYFIAPRMADRFAAVNMSAGHPNGADLTNLYNLPIQLQCGGDDDAYNRNRVTAEYDTVLNKLAQKYRGGYEHKVLIHAGEGHNFDDRAKAVNFLKARVRNPLPKKIVWNLAQRAPSRNATSFYWLNAAADVTSGIIVAEFDRKSNTITAQVDGVKGSFNILINELMVDVSRPVRLVLNGQESHIDIKFDKNVLDISTTERGDPNFQFIHAAGIDPVGSASAAMSDEDFVELCKKGSPQEAEAALKAGADANARDMYDTTALMWAATKNPNPEVIVVLVNAGADVHAKSMFDSTAFMCAATQNPNPEVITVLLNAGADVNAKDGNGLTALMVAAFLNPNPEVITTIVKAGADVHVKDKLGSAIDYAKANQNPAVYERLNDIMKESVLK